MSALAISWTLVSSRWVSHQKQDLWMTDESQRGGELPAGAAAVAVSDGASVVVQLQPLQEVTHHLEWKDLGYSGKKIRKRLSTEYLNFKSLYVTAHKWNTED